MNVNQIIDKIKEIAISLETVNSVFEGDVYDKWNSAEIKYASFNIGLQNVSNDGNLCTYTFVFYYGDRLTQDKNNANSIYTDGVNTIQSVINVLNYMQFDISEQINYTPFEQQFMDYLAGVYATVDIVTSSSLGFCNMDDYNIEEIIEIVKNGVYDVADYTTAVVNVIPQWGTIEGDINEQEDLIELIDGKVNPLESRIEDVEEELDDLGDFTCGTIVPTTTNFVEGTTYTTHEALQRTANLFGGFQGEIDDINDLIPSQATTQNQLADKAFVNSSIATNAANFRGNWTNWVNVPTNANQYPEDYVGNRTPTNNDYLVVQDASDYDGVEPSYVVNITLAGRYAGNYADIEYKDGIIRYNLGEAGTATVIGKYGEFSASGDNGWSKTIHANTLVKYSGDIYQAGARLPIDGDRWTISTINSVSILDKLQGSWRFIYVGDWATNGKNGWKPQYQIGSAFTAEQQAAIDSTITSTKVATYDGYGTKITALQTDKLDKNYTADKIYGTDSLGAQTVYTLGDGLGFSNGQIVNTKTNDNCIKQGSNNLTTNLVLAGVDGISNLTIRDNHADLIGVALHQNSESIFDRGIFYSFTPDKILLQNASTDASGQIENVTSEYKQTTKNIELYGEKIIANPTSAFNVNGTMNVVATDKTTKFDNNKIEAKVQNTFTIKDGSNNKIFETKSNQTKINNRLDVTEPERGNTLSLRKDAFETIVSGSSGVSNWQKMSAGGNPFAFGVKGDNNINDGDKTALLNTLPDGKIYVYGVDGYDGISTSGHRSLQTVISDLEDNVSNMGDDISNLNDNITDLQDNKQDVLEAGDGIEIKGNVIRATGGGGGIVTKNAQIRLTAWDTTQWDKLTAFVTTPVDRYRMVVNGTGTVDGARTNLDFDIEYDATNPLVTIMFMNNGHNGTGNSGFWLNIWDGGFDSSHFTQDWKPSVIAYIPWNFSRDAGTNFNGSYAGVTFQVNLKNYDLQRDGRIQLCNIQTSTMCYAEDTLITLSDGTTKMVQDITYDDVLKVWNFDEGKSDSAKPIWIKIEQTANQYALVTLSDGNSIKLVGTDGKYHCMFDMDEQKFNHAIDCIGHNVYTENGIVKVESLEIVNEPVKFYNIVTNIHLNCYANHILTSTEKNNIYPINDMKFVKDNRELKPYEAFENYGISLDDYNGWRLAEQPMSVEECVEFIKQRKKNKN